jgi:hypothetical protein
MAGQRFLLIDNRYFRSVDKILPEIQKNNEAQVLPVKAVGQDYETHFGKEGEDFLFKYLNSDKTPTWLVSGDQFFGAYHTFESYEGNHPDSFRNFLKQLKKAKSKVVFVSGDRHLSELMEIGKEEIGYSTFEVTSSPIHARNNPVAWAHDRNPMQLAGATGMFYFSLIESEVLKNKLHFKLTAFTSKKSKLYERNLVVAQ